MKYYHGSLGELPSGTVLNPNPRYEEHWGANGFYQVLEQYRPKSMIAHKDAVFMVGDIDDIDLAGGATDFIYEVAPSGEVQCHDVNWSSEICCLLDQGAEEDKLKEAAKKYWEGIPHPNESVWEFLTTSAKVIRRHE